MRYAINKEDIVYHQDRVYTKLTYFYVNLKKQHPQYAIECSDIIQKLHHFNVPSMLHLFTVLF